MLWFESCLLSQESSSYRCVFVASSLAGIVLKLPRVSYPANAWTRPEGREILEIGEEGEADLRPHVGELDVADHLAEYFHGARPAIAAIADESDSLVVPFAVSMQLFVTLRFAGTKVWPRRFPS